jgi:hypothetical protein
MKNLNTTSLLENYADFAEPGIQNRFCKHADLLRLINQLPPSFKVSVAGHSAELRSLHLIEWGNGPVKVFLWSQMHGDEATGTMALFDLINFLQQDSYAEQIELLRKRCSLYILPMVNPDGAERFTRRNAQQIDINRDFRKAVAPETQVLKKIHSAIKPDFGFNLHDQNTLWSVVAGTAKPATLSYLAPAYDQQLSTNNVRKNAMLVIAEMFKVVSPLLPGQIGLFDDEYEGRAFGDNFQLSGTSTILIEAGGFRNDEEKQEIRKYYFLSILAGLDAIATAEYQEFSLKDYINIPKNSKEIFHILIHGLMLDGIPVSIGLNYDEVPVADGSATLKTYSVQDIGDLDRLSAYEVYESDELYVVGDVKFNENANFDLLDSKKIILSFKNGILASKL